MLSHNNVIKSEPMRSRSKHRSTIKSTPKRESKPSSLTDSPKETSFIRKLKLCSITYNFLDQGACVKEKQIKLNILKELIEFVTEQGNVRSLSYTAYDHIISTVTNNISRALPPKENTDFDPEYDLEVQEISWPHLKLVYDFFLHFINSSELNISYFRKVIDRSFITQLIDLFNSEDVRERNCLKCILLSIYLKLFEQRAFIRKQIRNIFLKYIYESEHLFNGVSELLEILGMAINGFNVPLRQEHKDFLIKVLIPLHKPRYLAFYQKILIDCLKGFARKDENTIVLTIMGILKFWPKTCSEKEVLFLQELGELANMMSNQQFERIQKPLMKQISLSIASLHFQVAETALNLWENPSFSRLVNDNLKTVLPILFPELRKISRKHWNSEISKLARNLLRSFNEEDPALYNQLVAASKLRPKRKDRNC